MNVEAVVLTGGASRRMGEDKASLTIEGRTLLDRTLAEFDRIGVRATVLGREAVPGRAFLKDAGVHAGPAAALSRFVPSEEAVFVCACDLPFFNADCVAPMATLLGSHDAVVPFVSGEAQPLCALYSGRVFEKWRDSGERSMKGLLALCDVVAIGEPEMMGLGIDPRWFFDADSPEDLGAVSRL